MLLAGVLFDIGVVITAAAPNLAVLILGRILLGVAVAFASVAVTLYLSEMAPAHIRGRLNQIFQVRCMLAACAGLHHTVTGPVTLSCTFTWQGVHSKHVQQARVCDVK